MTSVKPWLAPVQHREQAPDVARLGVVVLLGRARRRRRIRCLLVVPRLVPARRGVALLLRVRGRVAVLWALRGLRRASLQHREHLRRQR